MRISDWSSDVCSSDLLGERILPPNFAYMNQLWGAIWDTLNIATLGTVLAIILAVPTAFLAALNTTPSVAFVRPVALFIIRSEEHTSELQSLMRISYAVFCLKKKKTKQIKTNIQE